MGRVPLGPDANDGVLDLASSASQSAARASVPAGDRFGDRRKSPVSKLRIPCRQAFARFSDARNSHIFQALI